MSTHVQTLEWIQKFGYDGDFPETFDKICNNSTSLIWDQLIQNIRSKMEVEKIRNNILVHRLNKKGLCLNKADKSHYPLEEIITYLKKVDLEKKIANINDSLREKQNTNRSLIQQNKIKCFSIEKINLRIKESEEREFLLLEKRKILGNDLQDAANIFNLLNNSNPADRNDIVNFKDITQMLQTCEEELEEKVKQLLLSSKNTSNETMNRPIFSTKKSVRKRNMFEQYLCLTEKQTANKIKKLTQNNDNIGLHKVNIRLFADDDIFKLKSKKSDESDTRESPEMHVEDNDDEHFLVDLSEAAPSFKCTTHSPLIAVEETYQSCLFNKTKNSLNHEESNKYLLKTIFKECVAKDITNLLHKYCRQTIWNGFRFLDDNIHFHISKKINFWNVKLPRHINHRSADLARLRFLHIMTEFKTIRNNLLLKQLTEQVNQKIGSMNVSLVNSGFPTDLISNLQKKLELKMEDVGLDCLLGVMKREINNIQFSSKWTDFSGINQSLLEVNEGIASRTNSLIQYLAIAQGIFVTVNRIRNTTSSGVRKLVPFASDFTWYSLLLENINIHEIEVFKKFPLEHNRKFVNTCPSLYFKDIHTDKFLCNLGIDNEKLNMLSDILDSPFSAPETVILNILRTKLKLDALKSIKTLENRAHYNKHALKDLQTQESYIVNTLEQLNALIASSTSRATLSAASISKKIMGIWIEVAFSDYISPNKTFEGKDYKSCEKVFDRFCSDL